MNLFPIKVKNEIVSIYIETMAKIVIILLFERYKIDTPRVTNWCTRSGVASVDNRDLKQNTSSTRRRRTLSELGLGR